MLFYLGWSGSGQVRDKETRGSESYVYVGEEGSWQKEQQSRGPEAEACLLCSYNKEISSSGAK